MLNRLAALARPLAVEDHGAAAGLGLAIYADHTGRPLEQIHDDLERDRFFSASEAADYGLIDRVIDQH